MKKPKFYIDKNKLRFALNGARCKMHICNCEECEKCKCKRCPLYQEGICNKESLEALEKFPCRAVFKALEKMGINTDNTCFRRAKEAKK